MKTPKDYDKELPEGYARNIVERIELSVATWRSPSSVKSPVLFTITSRPHLYQDNRSFYEVWFNWPGGTLRSSSCVLDPRDRDSLREFIKDMTGHDHDDTINTTLDKYKELLTNDNPRSSN